jgi:hypothetical protein
LKATRPGDALAVTRALRSLAYWNAAYISACEKDNFEIFKLDFKPIDEV